MRGLSYSITGLTLLVAVLGCNPKGTCKPGAGKASGELGEQCIVNYNKRPCENFMQGEFFEEEATAGLARCKGEGYESVGPAGDATRKLKAGQSVILYKRPKSKPESSPPPG